METREDNGDIKLYYGGDTMQCVAHDDRREAALGVPPPLRRRFYLLSQSALIFPGRALLAVRS
jgi:hypothetical protein